MGKRPEPLLSASLESVKDCLDILVINDNGENPENLEAVNQSSLFKANKIHLITSDFNGFAQARNVCLEYLKGLGTKPGELWILKLDADEVHTPGIYNLTRKILPRLNSDIGGIDGYWLLFIQSFEYFARFERRHDLLVRFRPEMRWEGRVHETLEGKSGRVIPLPYLYFHYGYVAEASQILAKWEQYREMGDRNFSFLAKANPNTLLDADSRTQFPLRAPHPQAALGAIEKLKIQHGENYLKFAELIKSQQTSKNRLAIFLKYWNYRQLIFFRKLQALSQPNIRLEIKQMLYANREYRI